jgi:hypothetical protein
MSTEQEVKPSPPPTAGVSAAQPFGDSSGEALSPFAPPPDPTAPLDVNGARQAFANYSEGGGALSAKQRASADQSSAAAGPPANAPVTSAPPPDAGPAPQPSGPYRPDDAHSVDAKADIVNSNRGDKDRFARLNEKDKDGKQSIGAYRKVYNNVGGLDVLVFLPGGGLTRLDPEVFVFFHGHDADYAGDKQNQFEQSGDNPAQAMDMAHAVTASAKDVIAILPASGEHGVFKWRELWKAKKVNFQTLLDGVLTRLAPEINVPQGQKLTPGTITFAGHSAGGEATGFALGDLDKESSNKTHEVTLQEAGYGFDQAWEKTAKWFLDSDAPKTLRVMTVSTHERHQELLNNYEAAKKKADAEPTDANQAAAKKALKAYGNSTRNAIEDGGGLDPGSIQRDISRKKVGEKALTNPKLAQMKAEKPTKGDGTKRADGLTLEWTMNVTGDGDRKIELYRYSKDKGDQRDAHFATRDTTMPELLKDQIP